MLISNRYKMKGSKQGDCTRDLKTIKAAKTAVQLGEETVCCKMMCTAMK
jgi:hypothetical protein